MFLDEIEKKIMSRLPSHELLTEEAEEYYRQLEYPQNDISDGSKHLQQVSFSVTLIQNTCESTKYLIEFFYYPYVIHTYLLFSSTTDHIYFQ